MRLAKKVRHNKNEQKIFDVTKEKMAACARGWKNMDL